MISFWEFGFLENSVMFLECLKNNSKILSDVIIMQFGKGVLILSSSPIFFSHFLDVEIVDSFFLIFVNFFFPFPHVTG